MGARFRGKDRVRVRAAVFRSRVIFPRSRENSEMG